MPDEGEAGGAAPGEGDRSSPGDGRRPGEETGRAAPTAGPSQAAGPFAPTVEHGAPAARPRHLLVVGAAAGMGRWLTEHVFATGPWAGACLVDQERFVDLVAPLADAFACRTTVAAAPDDAAGARALGLPDGDDADLVVCLAVPRSALTNICRWLVPVLPADAPLLHVSASLRAPLDDLRTLAPSHPVVGVHPLADTSARFLDGQTILVVPDEGDPATGGEGAEAPAWLLDDVHHAGGIAKVLSAADHDRSMSYVQTMAHQSLLNLIDAVAGSGLDLEELWEVRTPLFEALFGLATRVVSESREATTAEIQALLDGEQVAAELAAAAARTTEAIATGRQEDIEALIRATRDHFGGALFEAVSATAAVAVTAAQAKRSELARRGRTGALVGVRPLSRPDTLRVGHILELTPTAVTLSEVMVGPKGAAALLEGPGRRNARKIGQGGKPRRTTFGLAHIDVVPGDELEDELDEWLAHVPRDVRFLVPESVAGAGVLDVVGHHAAVRDAEVVSEVVRTGQRSVVVRVGIRADHDVDAMVEELRARVQQTYAWPTGVSLPARTAPLVHHLGPAGTFSEEAALHAAASVGITAPDLSAEPDFPTVLEGVAAGDLGVLPVSSSASGLVARASAALLAHEGELEAGGVVDVAVRFDAYVRPDQSLADLRGRVVFSHPQGLAQCGAFIRRWGLEPVPCPSTTDALARVAAAPDDEPCVALAGADRGGPHGLRVAEREVDDLPGSITRFVILGPPGSFGELVGGSDPTLRSICVAASLDAVLAAFDPSVAAFDELLTSPEGGALWITSRVVDPATPGLRHLGRVPWSPRTPVVRVETDVPTR